MAAVPGSIVVVVVVVRPVGVEPVPAVVVVLRMSRAKVVVRRLPVALPIFTVHTPCIQLKGQ